MTSSRSHTIDSFLEHTDEQLESMLDSGENLPAKVPGTPAAGSKKAITKYEAMQRRQMMSVMLANGAERDVINRAFEQKFGMTEGAVGTLIMKVRAMWADEDSQSAAYARHAARRRIHRHIMGATKAGKWTAVANLEKVLAEIDGTVVTDEESKPSDEATRVNDAILTVLNQTDPQKIRVLIEQQRMSIELPSEGAKKLPKAIDTEGV